MAPRVIADPGVDRVHPGVLVRRRSVERDDGAGDHLDACGVRRCVHRFELELNRVCTTSLVDVVDAGDDHDGCRLRAEDVAIESRANLIAALAVDAAVEYLPIAVRLRQPVGVLTLDVPGAVRRRLEWRLESRRSCRRRITEGDDCDSAHHLIVARIVPHAVLSFAVAAEPPTPSPTEWTDCWSAQRSLESCGELRTTQFRPPFLVVCAEFQNAAVGPKQDL